MESMTMNSARGASPSKLVQIVSDMEPQAIATYTRYTVPKYIVGLYEALNPRPS
jgi:hypothetical protein